MTQDRGSIWLQEGTYNALKQAKGQYETQVKGKVGWGAVLLLLLGLHIANKGMKQPGRQQSQTKPPGIPM